MKEQKDDELVVLETDNVLYADEGFRCARVQLWRSYVKVGAMSV